MKTKLLKTIIIIVLSTLILTACMPQSSEPTDTKKPEETKYADYLRAEYEKDNNINNQLTWLAYRWTVNNIESFNNPSSVTFADGCYYHKNKTGNVDYLLIEYRAQNKFGGYSTFYCYVTAYSIQEVDWTPPSIFPNYNGEQVWTFFISSPLKKALSEYIGENY